MMRTVRLALLTALLATASFTWPTPAGADETLSRLVLDDPEGDTWRNALTDEEPDPAGPRPASDVLSAEVVHRAGTVIATMQFADLETVNPQTYTFQLRTPRSNAVAWVNASADNWDGDVTLSSGREEESVCPGLTHAVDYYVDTVTVTVPRHCLGRPEWVRALMWNDSYVEENGQESWFGDNAHNSQAYADRPTRRLMHADAPDGVVLADAEGDVWTMPPNYEPAGSVPTVDFTKAVVRHGAKRLVALMYFADLQQSDKGQTFSLLSFSRQATRGAMVMVGPRSPKGRHLLFNGQFGLVRCPGFSHEVDYEEDRVTMSIPRRCMKSPTWVRTWLDSELGTRNAVTDNPINETTEFQLTPRLYSAMP